MIEHLLSLDSEITLFVNRFYSPFFDLFFYYVSNKYIWIPLYVVLLYLILRKYKKNSFLILLGIIFLIVLCDQTSVILFKNTFKRLRPCHDSKIIHLIHIVKNHCGGKYGFVSSHAANTTGLFYFYTKFIKLKWIYIFLVIQVLLVCYSRIYLGVHFFGDVLGGALLGFLIANMLYVLFLVMNKKTKYHIPL